MGSGRIANGRKWREGKVRPIPGNSPHDRRVSRGISFSFWRICDDPFPATPLPQLQRTILGRPVCVFKAWRNLSGPMWFPSQNQTLGRDRAASRRSAPGPGKRTRREDHAPSHRPQMSSGRLFLDRGARQQSPSLLHRQPQNNTHSSSDWAKGDISTLPARGHFYFALTNLTKTSSRPSSFDTIRSPKTSFSTSVRPRPPHHQGSASPNATAPCPILQSL